ncbi:MAG: imidazolonepropionase [Candidatus Kariarchaeaceae archaeon]
MNGWITNLCGLFDGYEFHQGPLHIEISDGLISNIETKHPHESSFDGRGQFLSPGFIDGHTHLIFAGDRFNELAMKLSGMSYSEILERGGGIQSTVRASRSASFEDLVSLTSARLDTMLSNGTTFVEAKSGYGLNLDSELLHLEVLNHLKSKHSVTISSTFGAAHVIPPELTPDNYVELIIDEMLPEVAKRNLAGSTDVFCDKGAFNVEQTLEIFTAATGYGQKLKVHAEELEYTGIAQEASTKFDLLSADHLLLATKPDFEILSQTNTVAMFMPMAPFSLFSSNRPRGFSETDVTIGLGSDFNPNNWSISMQSAIRFAVYTYRLTPIQAMRGATSGSYLGITGTKFPRISIGSPADFILIRSQSPSEFVSKFGQNLVTHVFSNGELLLSNQQTII